LTSGSSGTWDLKFDKAALRWLVRYVIEGSPSLLNVQVALAAMAELRTNEEAAKTLLLRLSAGPTKTPLFHSLPSSQ
jgi:hypothetical protein